MDPVVPDGVEAANLAVCRPVDAIPPVTGVTAPCSAVDIATGRQLRGFNRAHPLLIDAMFLVQMSEQMKSRWVQAVARGVKMGTLVTYQERRNMYRAVSSEHRQERTGREWTVGGRQDACVRVHITATPISYRAIRGKLTLAYCGSRRVWAFHLPIRIISEPVENPYRILLSCVPHPNQLWHQIDRYRLYKYRPVRWPQLI